MEPTNSYYVVVTEQHPLNIRSGPGKHHRKIGTIPAGAIVCGTPINEWLQTTLQGETCYLSMDYLQPVEPTGVLCYTADEIRRVISWLEGLL